MTAALALLRRHWPLAALLASATMLAIAHGFETFGHLAPCTLCLKAREVYWVAMAVAAVVIVASRLPGGPRWRTLGCWALALVFAVGVGVAVYHAGAEWKFWPGPKTCASGGAGASAGSMAALLRGEAIAPPACDKAVWVFLGLSMAGWNGLVSFALTAFSVYSARLARD